MNPVERRKTSERGDAMEAEGRTEKRRGGWRDEVKKAKDEMDEEEPRCMSVA